jgi:RimJ/RimL family protein N-acetyltransferase
MHCAPLLRTERLILRGWREEDFEPMVPFWADEASSRYVGGPCGRDAAWRIFAAFLGHWMLRGYGFWALENRESGELAGYCGLWKPEGWPEEEIGWSLLPQARGKGLVTEAAQRVRRYAYEDLGLTTLISFVDPDNAPSAAVARRLGAQRDGQLTLRGSIVDIWRHPGPAEISRTQH